MSKLKKIDVEVLVKEADEMCGNICNHWFGGYGFKCSGLSTCPLWKLILKIDGTKPLIQKLVQNYKEDSLEEILGDSDFEELLK